MGGRSSGVLNNSKPETTTMSDDEAANRGDDQPLPPITHERRASLSASSAISVHRVCVTRKTAVLWGVVVSGVASGATSVTEPVAGLLGLTAPEWWFSAAIGIVGGALVAWKVPAKEVEHTYYPQG
jgi:hypothetical protein